MTKEMQAIVAQELAKLCYKEDVKRIAEIVELPDGGLLPIMKRMVETRFCFGESGYDYADAQNMAEHARTNTDYFMQENMRKYTSMIDDLLESLDRYAFTRVGLAKYGWNQPDDCRLRGMAFLKSTDIIDACGGSCNLDELPGKTVNIWGTEYRIATDEEVLAIIDGYKKAAQAHEKKLRSYLKRYGMSKVHTWTYWRDA